MIDRWNEMMLLKIEILCSSLLKSFGKHYDDLCPPDLDRHTSRLMIMCFNTNVRQLATVHVAMLYLRRDVTRHCPHVRASTTIGSSNAACQKASLTL